MVNSLFDSGSSVSLVTTSIVQQSGYPICEGFHKKLVSASGNQLEIRGRICLPIIVGEMKIDQMFVVVSELITPVILGIDFLIRHKVHLDFGSGIIESPDIGKVKLDWPHYSSNSELHLKKISNSISTDKLLEKENANVRNQAYLVQETPLSSAMLYTKESTHDIAGDCDECYIPCFEERIEYDIPSHPKELSELLDEFKDRFSTTPERTDISCHKISTGDSRPSLIPARRVPVHYQQQVDQQLKTMLEQGIIKESNSPWVAPAVYVTKKDGSVRICVDYRELNKKTVKDAYPLPLVDDVQAYVEGARVFSTLDLHTGYWQLPIHPEDTYKTAFTPGPGMGLFEFVRMPFGVCNGPSSFQRVMESVLRNMSNAKVFIDDILIFSDDMKTHITHLREVFTRLRKANLTLRGKKCCLASSSVRYLGYVFTADGMLPDPSKVEAIKDCPIPTDVATLQHFLGITSYYRKFIANFFHIATPLNALLKKGAEFNWTDGCVDSFSRLKEALIKPPVHTPQLTGSSQCALMRAVVDLVLSWNRMGELCHTRIAHLMQLRRIIAQLRKSVLVWYSEQSSIGIIFWVGISK